MEKLLLENLAILQSFDATLRRNPTIDQIAAAFIATIMFEQDPERRARAAEELEAALILYFTTAVQPAAREVGIANARRILKAIGPGDLADTALRQRVLIDLDLRLDERLRIVQALVNDSVNTLGNRLTAYWLEPGQNDAQKLTQLKKLHADFEKRRRDYEQGVRKALAGEIAKPPRRPVLDFHSRMVADVKRMFREQARRSGTDAETATFTAQGHLLLTWITVNADDACPDCKLRQGSTGDLDFWDKLGRPGSGKTICGASCFCLLVPAATITRSPNLANGLSTRGKRVLTTEADLQRLRRSR